MEKCVGGDIIQMFMVYERTFSFLLFFVPLLLCSNARVEPELLLLFFCASPFKTQPTTKRVLFTPNQMVKEKDYF